MRCSFVTETFLPEINGVTLTLGKMVTGLQNRGFEIQVIRPAQAADKTSAKDPIDNLDKVLVKGLPIPGYADLRFGLPTLGIIQRSWKRFRPDVVYVATEGPLGFSAMRAARKMGIPVISGFHTNFHTYMQHYHIGFAEKVVFWWLRYFHNKTQATLVPTFQIKKELSEKGIERIEVFGRGVDCERFSPQRRSPILREQWGIADNERAVIHVGRMAAEKNITLAVKAFEQMKQIDSSLRFVLVGDGPLMGIVRSKYPDYIYCGMQTGIQLAEHYASADIFLFPSMTETFGNVVLEGLASGLALVAYDYAAPQMHIVSGESGLLAPFADESGYIEQACKIAKMGADELQTMRDNALAHAQKVTWDAEVDKLNNLIERITA